MNKPARRMLVPLLMAIVLFGCLKPPSGPASVNETSATGAELADRIQFIEKYVTFRRNYDELDYAIMYQNNGGGMVPAPSDWDIRLIAIVPETEIENWIPAGADKENAPSPEWLNGLPGTIQRDGIREWYRQSGITVGVDRDRSIIAYRNTSNPD